MLVAFFFLSWQPFLVKSPNRQDTIFKELIGVGSLKSIWIKTMFIGFESDK